MKIEEIPKLVEALQRHNKDWNVVAYFDAGREVSDFAVSLDDPSKDGSDEDWITTQLAVERRSWKSALETLIAMAEN